MLVSATNVTTGEDVVTNEQVYAENEGGNDGMY